ncbi:MAG: hypothetical protein Q9163_002408 [Psora crenata]
MSETQPREDIAGELGMRPEPKDTDSSKDKSTAPWSVQSVLSTIPNPPAASPSPTSPLPFLHVIERLKTTPREGWRRFGLSSAESIADHMYRMSIITMLAPRSLASKLNLPHCTKMALVHDMAESLVGDITPVDGVTKEEKGRRERETMMFLGRGLLGGYDGGQQGEELHRIWEEYEKGETMEARFVKDVDKLELLLQMMEYERSREGRVDLGEFVRVAQHIQMEEMRTWCTELLAERDMFWRAVGRQDGDDGRDGDRRG